MNTVYVSIVNWLNEILLELKKETDHSFTVIDLERIPLPSDYPQVDFQAAGLFSSPNDQTSTLMGGQVKYTSFKSFFLRRPFKEFSSRLDNENFFEKLAKRIHDRNLDGNLPKDGRQWKEISVNSGVYPAMRDTAETYADYLIPLKLVYIE